MLEFHEITAEDGDWAVPLLRAGGSDSCEYSFVNIFIWAHIYRSKIARFQDQVVVRSEGEHSLHYLFPAGTSSEQAALEAILADCAADGRRLVVFSVSPAAKERTERAFPGKFLFQEARDNFDYLYNSHDLADLPGGKFQKKRNHVSRFLREHPDWAFHPITPEVMPRLLEFNDQWCHLYNNMDVEGIRLERIAIERAFRHYDRLGLRGGYVTAEGRIVAYSFGSELNERVFDEHVEKALYDVDGAYNIINREMARAYGGQYALINREDDVGEEGLRKAKLSYHPERLEVKYQMELLQP